MTRYVMHAIRITRVRVASRARVRAMRREIRARARNEHNAIISRACDDMARDAIARTR